MNQFKVVYLLNDKPCDYMTRKETAHQAEVKFLEWASENIPAPVRVVRVEKVNI